MNSRIAATLTGAALIAAMGTAIPSDDGSQATPDDPSHEGAQRDDWRASFYSGNEFRGLPDKMRLTYIAALVEGMTSSSWAIKSELETSLPRSEARELIPRFEFVNRCAARMRLDELSTAVDRYLAAHPGQWHLPMFDIVQAALREACRAQGES